MIDDEVDAVKSIFCRVGEVETCTKYASTCTTCTVNLRAVDSEPDSLSQFNCRLCQRLCFGSSNQYLTVKKQPLTVTFDIPSTYPAEIPVVSLASTMLTQDEDTALKDCAMSVLKRNIDNPMLLDVLTQLQEEYTHIVKSRILEEHTANNLDLCDSCGCGTDSHLSPMLRGSGKVELPSQQELSTWTIIIRLDHMRAKSRYVKQIKAWTEELVLNGRLLFQGKKFILILLQGDLRNLKEYLVRHKSTNIDIDSRGRSCKERMLSVLCEQQVPGTQRFSDFVVLDLCTFAEMDEFFKASDLHALFTKYILPIR